MITTVAQRDRVIAVLKACEASHAAGLDRVMLIKTMRSRPRGSRVIVLPGVTGEVVGSTAPGRYLVSCAIVDVVRALEAVMCRA